jgi:protein phosphatase
MGSRAVVIVCRDSGSALKRFGVSSEAAGICYTRTGRQFFDDFELEKEFISKVRGGLDASGFWDEFKTDWVCLDAELMPWSAKAQELLRRQYAAVGAAAQISLSATVAAMERSVAMRDELAPIIEHHQERLAAVNAYVDAYRRYCWPVRSVNDFRLAPFHILATEGHVYTDRNHVWHMEALAKVCGAADGLLRETPFTTVDVTDESSTDAASRWWTELTARGGEGIVVKPLEFVNRGRRGLVQPALKCRGREYLRIIYGPEYLLPENLSRLRARGVAAKRSLSVREFALGIEALERFVKREPLRRVHECVFGVLALESEPVDPRL